MKKTVSIIIPSWNAVSLLKKNLPSVVTSRPDELIVVDDGSIDASKDFVSEVYPQIKLLVHPRNMGFIQSINDGVKISNSDIVVLLNNDVSPEKNFLIPLVSHFEDDTVFSVCSAVAGYGYSKASFTHGFVSLSQGKPTSRATYALWASGGSAAYSRLKWDKLGGFDDMLKPFYFEDIDVSYRAWKRGWKVLWEPESRVNHTISSTIGKKFSKEYVDRVSQRNHLLFIWKNITSKRLISDHRHALTQKIRSGEMLQPIFSAFAKLGQAYARRQIEKKESILTDEEIFAKFR